LSKFSIILWDFDGVILNSNEVRDLGFEQVLADYPKEQVDQLLDFHRKNGGLSRYVKFRYFYENVLHETLTDERLTKLTNSFSEIMRKLLCNPGLLIQESIDFISKNHEIYPMYIVSGSDQEELRFLCKTLNIEHYFKGVFGSPTPKNDLVNFIIKNTNQKPNNFILIGDSINDYEAAKINNIGFLAFNNLDLNQYNSIDNFLEQA
jgi:phosphoglycolate phosphatase-like HAD superfamily hydrolase